SVDRYSWSVPGGTPSQGDGALFVTRGEDGGRYSILLEACSGELCSREQVTGLVVGTPTPTITVATPPGSIGVTPSPGPAAPRAGLAGPPPTSVPTQAPATQPPATAAPGTPTQAGAPAPTIVNLGCGSAQVTAGERVTCAPVIEGAADSYAWTVNGTAAGSGALLSNQ